MFNKFSDLFKYGQPKNGIIVFPRLSKKESDSLHSFIAMFFKGLQRDECNDVNSFMKTIYCPRDGFSYFIPTKKGEIELKIGKRKYTKAKK